MSTRTTNHNPEWGENKTISDINQAYWEFEIKQMGYLSQDVFSQHKDTKLQYPIQKHIIEKTDYLKGKKLKEKNKKINEK